MKGEITKHNVYAETLYSEDENIANSVKVPENP